MRFAPAPLTERPTKLFPAQRGIAIRDKPPGSEVISGEAPELTLERTPKTAGPPRRLSPEQRERFDALVLPHLDAAYNLARYLLRDPHEAEEAVQNAFLRALEHFEGLRGTDGRAWLLSIVRNTCYTQFHRRGVGGDKVEFDEEIHSVDSELPGPEADLVRSMAVASVRAGLDRLGIEFREVLVLRELEGLSYKEIAQVTDVA